jgi:hypothetical protein
VLIGLTHLTASAATVTLKHDHGLAFSQDGQQLSIPSCNGSRLKTTGLAIGAIPGASEKPRRRTLAI